MPTSPRNTDHSRLRALCAQLETRITGHPLHRIQAGNGWVRLLLAGEDRLSLLMVTRPGVPVDLLWQGKLPPSIRTVLKPQRDHPLDKLLTGHVLERCRVLGQDRVIGLQLKPPVGRSIFLMHQIFGARGNLALLDHTGCLLWAEHRPPHTLLATVPRSPDWATPPTDAEDLPDPQPPVATMQQLAQHFADNLALSMTAHLRRRLKTSERLVTNLARDFTVAGKGEEFRRKAEALATHLHEVQSGQAELNVPDPRDGTPLSIALDPALRPAANLAAWFKQAGKAEKGYQIIADRLLAAERRLQTDVDESASLETLLADLPEDHDALSLLDDLLDWGKQHDLLPQPKTGPRRKHSPYSPEQPARPFRRYKVEDSWEVWVGRNNKENDQLTHHSSHLRDLWFHAQGVSGSHVILRTNGKPDQVPRRIIAKAAALAALNSKAKHSNLVPVIWTERRYVRKPRKAPPGLAVCLQEKTIMVAPGIGPDVRAF